MSPEAKPPSAEVAPIPLAEYHYAFLGLSPSASRVEVESSLARLTKVAAALANSAPQQSHVMREGLRAIKEELLVNGSLFGTEDIDDSSGWKPGASRTGDLTVDPEHEHPRDQAAESAASPQPMGDRLRGHHLRSLLARLPQQCGFARSEADGLEVRWDRRALRGPVLIILGVIVGIMVTMLKGGTSRRKHRRR